MTLFKPRVGKVIFAQATGGLCVITPIYFYNSLVDMVLFCFFSWEGGLLCDSKLIVYFYNLMIIMGKSRI